MMRQMVHHEWKWFRDLAWRLRVKMTRVFDAQNFSGTSFLLFLSVLIGIGGGLGAVGFRWLIETSVSYMFRFTASIMARI